MSHSRRHRRGSGDQPFTRPRPSRHDTERHHRAPQATGVTRGRFSGGPPAHRYRAASPPTAPYSAELPEVDGLYFGELTGSLREGYGVLTFPDTRQYRGGFHRGQMNGHGLYRFPDGVIYEGTFVNGRICGPGTFLTPRGGEYHVDWTEVDPFPDAPYRFHALRERGVLSPSATRASPVSSARRSLPPTATTSPAGPTAVAEAEAAAAAVGVPSPHRRTGGGESQSVTAPPPQLHAQSRGSPVATKAPRRLGRDGSPPEQELNTATATTAATTATAATATRATGVEGTPGRGSSPRDSTDEILRQAVETTFAQHRARQQVQQQSRNGEYGNTRDYRGRDGGLDHEWSGTHRGTRPVEEPDAPAHVAGARGEEVAATPTPGPQPDAWECRICTLLNAATDVACAACEAPRGAEVHPAVERASSLVYEGSPPPSVLPATATATAPTATTAAQTSPPVSIPKQAAARTSPPPPPPQQPQQAQSEGSLCVICLERARTHVMVPCGHFCICEVCYKRVKLTTCPLCRVHVAMCLKVFQ